jgi:hypothetical protein
MLGVKGVRVQIVDSDKSPYAIKEIEVEGKFTAATITEDLVIIYVKSMKQIKGEKREGQG